MNIRSIFDVCSFYSWHSSLTWSLFPPLCSWFWSWTSQSSVYVCSLLYIAMELILMCVWVDLRRLPGTAWLQCRLEEAYHLAPTSSRRGTCSLIWCFCLFVQPKYGVSFKQPHSPLSTNNKMNREGRPSGMSWAVQTCNGGHTFDSHHCRIPARANHLSYSQIKVSCQYSAHGKLNIAGADTWCASSC